MRLSAFRFLYSYLCKIISIEWHLLLQTLWKNIKITLKKQSAEARRKRFTTGGGPPKDHQTDEFSDVLSGMIEDQQPLDGIPDDDHLDSANEELSLSPNGNFHIQLCQSSFQVHISKCVLLRLFIFPEETIVTEVTEPVNGQSRLKQSNDFQCIFLVHPKAVSKSYFIKVIQWITSIHKYPSGQPL